MNPSQVALVPVAYIEERAGRALVRLPNGSKTSIDFGALIAQPFSAHFVPAQIGSGVTTYCRDCEWADETADWPDALRRLARHYDDTHPTSDEPSASGPDIVSPTSGETG